MLRTVIRVTQPSRGAPGRDCAAGARHRGPLRGRATADEALGHVRHVPYGDQWYEYLMRRLAERPANLVFAARALAGRS